MPTATIVIEVDDQAAVQSVKRLGDTTNTLDPSLQKVGQRGNVVLTDLSNRTERARQSAMLLANMTGVQLPRALEQVLAKTPGVQSALNAAFAATVVITLTKEVLALVDNLTGYSEQLAKIKQQSDAIMASAAQANTTLLGPQSLDQINARILGTTKNIDELNKHFGLTGDAFGDALKRGISKYSASESTLLDQLDQQKDLLNVLYGEQAKLTDQQRRTEPVEILKEQNAARLAGLLGIAKINSAERAQVAETLANSRAVAEDAKLTQAKITAIHAEAAAERIALHRAEDDATRHIAQQAILSGLKGIAAINDAEQDSFDELDKLRERGLVSEKNYQERRRSITLEAANKRAEIERQAAEQTQQMQEDAALATVAPWYRSNAQIVTDANRRIRSIQQALRDTTISEQQAAIQVSAVWQQAFAQMRDNLAQSLESLFDDITSGNIGKRFLDQFKHLVFQMIATWMLGLNQMRSASQGATGGGGLFGSILGPLLGINLGGGGGAGVPSVSEPGFGIPIPGFAAGGAGSGTSSSGGGLLSGLFGGFFGGSSSSSAAAVGVDSLPTALTSSQASALSLLGGTPLSAGGGAAGAILPAGASAAIGGGKGFSGVLSRLGGLGSVFGMLAMGGMSLLGTKNRALQGLGGFLTGGAIGSLVAMSSIGLSLGALGAFLGPIGAIAGLLIGLFGFGGSTKRARLQIEAQMKAQAQKIEDSYNAHQLDYDPAMSQLEQLRQQGVDALRQAGVKDISRSRVGHVDHWVDKAENEMRATEAERARRLAVAFGPAQFRVGGFVSPNLAQGYPALFGASALHFAGGGAVPAILHAGEFVFRPEAVRQHGVAKLARMNAGDGGGGTTINIQAWDAKSVEQWLRNGGSALISRAQRRDDLEGRF